MEKGNPPPYSPSAPPQPGFVMSEQQKCYPALPVTDPAPTVVSVQTQQAAPTVVVVGGCPSCRIGVIRTSHITFCGILWSIILFPFGLLCLLCCTKKRCSNCSYTD